MSPKTKNKFEQIRKESKAKILDAALKLFGTQGYQKYKYIRDHEIGRGVKRLDVSLFF